MFPEDRRDFVPDMIAVTFEADEFGIQGSDIQVRVPIVDDDVDEADEEVFILVVAAPGISVEAAGRTSSLCIIQDDDGL